MKRSPALLIAALAALPLVAACDPVPDPVSVLRDDAGLLVNGKRPIETQRYPSPTTPPDGWFIRHDCDTLWFTATVASPKFDVRVGPTHYSAVLNQKVAPGETVTVAMTGDRIQGQKVSAFVDDRLAETWQDC